MWGLGGGNRGASIVLNKIPESVFWGFPNSPDLHDSLSNSADQVGRFLPLPPCLLHIKRHNTTKASKVGRINTLMANILCICGEGVISLERCDSPPIASGQKSLGPVNSSPRPSFGTPSPTNLFFYQFSR